MLAVLYYHAEIVIKHRNIRRKLPPFLGVVLVRI